MQFSHPLASLKDVQATGEAFCPQLRTASTSKNEIYLLSLFVGRFCPPGSVSNLDMDPDPTPVLQHCCYYGQNFLDKMTKQSDKYIATF